MVDLNAAFAVERVDATVQTFYAATNPVEVRIRERAQHQPWLRQHACSMHHWCCIQVHTTAAPTAVAA